MSDNGRQVGEGWPEGIARELSRHAEDIDVLQKGQRELEIHMTHLIGTDGDGGVLGALVSTVGKLDQTVGSINETMIGWKAILSDRKDRNNLWFPIIAALLAAVIGLLAVMWSTHPGHAALSTIPPTIAERR